MNKGKEKKGNDGKEGRKKERKRAERKGELMRRKGVERRKKDEIGDEIRRKWWRTEKCWVKDGMKCKERRRA